MVSPVQLSKAADPCIVCRTGWSCKWGWSKIRSCRSFPSALPGTCKTPCHFWSECICLRWLWFPCSNPSSKHSSKFRQRFLTLSWFLPLLWRCVPHFRWPFQQTLIFALLRMRHLLDLVGMRNWCSWLRTCTLSHSLEYSLKLHAQIKVKRCSLTAKHN